eukprot:10131879-Prorocentrum_lima.AAC.1
MVWWGNDLLPITWAGGRTLAAASMAWWGTPCCQKRGVLLPVTWGGGRYLELLAAKNMGWWENTSFPSKMAWWEL